MCIFDIKNDVADINKRVFPRPVVKFEGRNAPLVAKRHPRSGPESAFWHFLRERNSRP